MTKSKRIEKLNTVPQEGFWEMVDFKAWFAAMCAVGVIGGWMIAVSGNY